MVSITEDEKIWSVFHDIRWLEVQLNEKMRTGDKDPFFGFIKESNFLLVEDKIKYERKMTRLEKKLDELLYKLNRIEIRETLKGLEHVKDLTALRKGSFQLDEVWDELGEKIIDYHIKEGLVDRDIFIENYYRLEPPYVKIGTEIPKGIKKICEESRWCYVYEQYNATIVLSRSIIETILKDKLGRNKIRNLNAKQIIDHAAYKEIISENVSGEAHNIRKQANEILHKAKVATRQEAKSALDYILIFLQEIYFV